MSQEVIFCFDDSGVLHPKERSGYFVYAGYVFTSREEFDNAKREYIRTVKNLRVALSRTDELKASTLKGKHKRALYNVLRQYESVSCSVEIPKVYSYILANKKAICRYKDYVLKRCVKEKLIDLVRAGKVNPCEDVHITVMIDEQLTASDGYYTLTDSIREELQHGIVNFNYGVVHPPVFHSEVVVEVHYCESKSNYLVQASDILANRVWKAFVTKKTAEYLDIIPNHKHLTFP